MPKIINAFSSDDGLASTLSGLANNIFGGNVAQQEVYRQNAIGKRRENENIPLLADAVVAGDTAGATRAGIMSGQDPKFTGGYNQFRQVTQYGPESRQGFVATMAVPSANYGNTVQGVNADLGNKRAIAQMTADRQARAIETTADNTPVNVLENGVPKIVSRRDAITRGLRPVLDFGAERGTLLQGMQLTPQQQETVVGANRTPGTPYSYLDATGARGTTFDARTDATTGRSLAGPIQTIKLEGPNAEGLSGNSTVDRQLLDSRVATENAVAMIDGLTKSLSQPNADQAVGYLGTVARGFNDLRAQVEAGARLFGSQDTKDTVFNTPEARTAVDQAINGIFANSVVNQKAQQLGVNSAIIRSQIQDLAYMIAKAQDPGGRVSTDDIRRAAETVGATIMDPKSAVQVLGDLKQRIIQGHEIRERTTRQMYPRVGAPTAGAPASAAPPAEIRIDVNGNIIQ